MILQSTITFLTLGLYTAALAMTPTALDPVRTVFEFPNNTYVENLAVRSNGQILVSVLTKPQLFLIDPSAPGQSEAILVHEFAGSLGVSGIAEYQPDVFAVITGNFSFETGDVGVGSWNVWSVDLRGVHITNVSPAHFLNGISLLSQAESTLMIGDINVGDIYRLDVLTSNYEVVINNTFTAAVPAPPFPLAGVDGVRVHNGSSLFFTNIGKGTFNKVSINIDGTPVGPITTLANTLTATDEYDDFTFDCDGNAFLVTGGGNSIEMISADGRKQIIIAGRANSTAIAEPTSCAFGRGSLDKNVLYVVTAGGLAVPVNGETTIGGQLVAVTTNSRGNVC
ncbi:Putative hetero-Diels-Alderase-like protein [Cladobotryum mycophilum]|uniref:Hetero-Diels-Alderase-like protein n=1 Tax=Cladobotryum mycophilum TaxID=491253 RepID=A0ABR0SBM7_9HYPO